MSTSKYTPGPWSALRARTLINIKGPNGEQITQVSIDREADARLLAAAPDMLEALRMVRDADDDCRADGLPTMPPAPRAKIDAALAKAGA